MLKAIETSYKGYRFRSRLEARWAVFFDALNVPWEYEAQGYDLGDAGWYLPDFWLPHQKCWIEIKGSAATLEEGLKATALAKGSGDVVVLIWGTPGKEDGVVIEGKTGADLLLKGYPLWCDLFGCKHGLNSALGSCFCRRINNAYAAARSARFEHGEHP